MTLADILQVWPSAFGAGVRHWHVCEECAAAWSHDEPAKGVAIDHRCPRCKAGPFVEKFSHGEAVAYQQHLAHGGMHNG